MVHISQLYNVSIRLPTALLGHCDVELSNGVILKRCCIFQRPDRAWVLIPDHPAVSDADSVRIKATILAALRASYPEIVV